MKIEDLKQHMVIEAYSREEAFGIAQEELDMLHKALHTESKKAKVSAYNLNERGFRYYSEKLGERDLIIENAGQLKYPIVDEIEEYIIKNGKKNILVLTDIINNFDKLALDRPSFLERFDIYSVLSERKQDKFEEENDIKKDFGEREKNIEEKETSIYVEKVDINNQRREEVLEKEKSWPENAQLEPVKEKEIEINKEIEKDTTEKNISNEVHELNEEKEEQKPIIKKVKDMNVDDFVEYCKDYARSIDCTLPGKTIPALYECIEDMIERGEALTEKKAVELIESAADKAEKPKLFYKPKYDKDGNLVLLEEHFLES